LNRRHFFKTSAVAVGSIYLGLFDSILAKTKIREPKFYKGSGGLKNAPVGSIFIDNFHKYYMKIKEPNKWILTPDSNRFSYLEGLN